MPNNWCAYHNRKEEPTVAEPYMGCGECWHIWNTEQELMDDYNKMMDEIEQEVNEGYTEPIAIFIRKTNGWQLMTCPLCSHDF